MVDSLALIQFEEKPYQVFFLDFRIYIQGIEVTQFVTGALTITKANRDGAGTASFQLDNALDRFVITKENLAGKWRDTTDKYSEAAKHGIYLYKKGAGEAAIDRVAELVNDSFETNLAAIQAKTDDPKNKRRLDRDQRNDAEINKTEAKELKKAAKDTLQGLPAEDVIRNSAAVEQALFEQLAARGLSEQAAAQQARAMTDRRYNQLTDAGKVRPKSDGPVQEVNVDGTPAEGRGRFKRQKFIRNPIDSDTGDSRWPLEERSTVFHKNDPIRIFIHNPLTEDDWWLYGFTGFVDTYPVQTDYLTSQSTITIACYDIRALMQKMRVSQNSTLPTVAPEPLFLDRTSVFADLLFPSNWGKAFANLSFENAISYLMTGATIDGKGDGIRFGVGEAKAGWRVTYPVDGKPESSISKATLEEWHSLCINGGKKVPEGSKEVSKGFANLAPLTSAEVQLIGSKTTSTGEYSPMRPLVHFLLPEKGTAARNLTNFQFDAGSEQRDWVTRFEIVTDFCARIDYEWTVLPNGDMAFEFPMYDFSPEDFGSWSTVFTADWHLINGGYSDEGGDIITALTVQGGTPNTEIDPFSSAPKSFAYVGLIQSSVMAARVGVTVDNASLPFVSSRERLRSLGLIEFQKRLANANTMDMDFGFRPFITPNRPMYNAVEKRMGLTSSIVETLAVFDKASTAAAIRFIRQVRDDGTFRLITGGDSMPISYRKIFPGDVKSVGNTRTTGVRTTLEVDGDPDALTSDTEVQENTSGVNNEDRPPSYVQEIRPGTYFTMAPAARRVADVIAQAINGVPFLLNNIPEAGGRIFSIRARDADQNRVYADSERSTFATKARENGYILVDTGNRFAFEPRRPGQPDFIVRPDRA